MRKYLIIFEKTGKNYSAYSPDLPGCVATGITKQQAEKNMYEAIEMHLEGLAEDRIPLPQSHSSAEYVTFLKAA